MFAKLYIVFIATYIPFEVQRSNPKRKKEKSWNLIGSKL